MQILQVAEGKASELRKQEVSSTRCAGLEVSVKAALVTTQVFSVMYGTPPDAVPNVPVVTVHGPEGLQLTGAVMALDGMPAGTPHYELKLH
eukprot:2733797-Lingulodinium_polyedra.AAC.1